MSIFWEFVKTCLFTLQAPREAMRILCLLFWHAVVFRVSWGRWVNQQIHYMHRNLALWKALDEFLTSEVRENSVKILYHVILKCPFSLRVFFSSPLGKPVSEFTESGTLFFAERIDSSVTGSLTGPPDPWPRGLYNIRQVCTLSPDHIFAQWFSSSVLQSSAFGQLCGTPNEVNASGDPLVHLLSLAIRSCVHSFL